MKHRILLFLFLLFTIGLSVNGQKSYNFGESRYQKEGELPKSKVPFQKGVRVPKRNEETVLNKINKTDYLLSSGWELAESSKVIASPKSLFEPDLNTLDWYNAVVPGTVLTTLVEQGIYPDPYWGLNNLAIPDSLCHTDWWYRLVFDIPQAEYGKRTFLRLEGINYKAEVWLNYQLVGKMVGAFSRGEFDVTGIVHNNKKNVLAVRILPPDNPGIPHEQNSKSHGGNGGVLCLDGPTFISSEGWDWVPGIRDRNIGIWQDVLLSFRGDISIKDPQIITDLPLPDTSSAEIMVKMEVENSGNEKRLAEVYIQLEDIVLSKSFSLEANECKQVILSPNEFPQLKIHNPRLWWPNGYGEPELYKIELSVLLDNQISDKRTVRFGIRELEYELSLCDADNGIKRMCFNPLLAYQDDEMVIDNLNKVRVGSDVWVPSLVKKTSKKGLIEMEDNSVAPFIVLRVNGQRIFCRGGNWGMDDAMKRVSRERLEPYLRMHKEQGFTMIRNWTAESTEELFYELCDEYGILVFNDFGLSTENINLQPSDHDLFLKNIKEVVTRFRNHPSIALWCPQNEGFPSRYLEEGMSEIIVTLDGTRHYLGNSRTLNSIKSGPWQYIQPVEYYKKANGFASEVGSPSLPTAESLRKMMAEEDLWPIGDVWYYHDWLKGKWGNEPLIQSYEDGINQQFGVSSSVDEFSWKAQLINYESYRAIFEGWNSRLFQTTSGVLLWMSHPAWPSMVWQTYTWDYETPGAYWGAKKGCEPVHVQYNMLTHEIEVINTTLYSLSGLQIIGQIISLDGKILYEVKDCLNISSNQVKKVMELKRSHNQSDCYFIRLLLKDKGNIISQNFYWMSDKAPRDFTPLNKIPEVILAGNNVKLRKEGGNIRGTVILKNNTDKVAMTIKLNIRNAKTDMALLPAYFDDGYFSLLPGEEKKVEYEFPFLDQSTELKLTIEGFNVERRDIALRIL